MSIDRRSWLGAVLSGAAAIGPLSALAQTAPLVRIATSPAESYAQAFFAQDTGLFQKAGLNVEVQLLSTGSAVSAGVAGGAVDVGVATTVNLANAIVRGIPFVLIAPAIITTAKVPGGLLCVAKSSPIRTAKDLEGKIIAVPALKQLADLAARVWLAKGGADVSRVQIVETAFSDMGPGIERGTYAAAIISEPALTNAMSRNNLRSLADPYQAIAPEYMVAGWFTTAQFAQKNPEIVRKVAAALTEAGRWANTHHTETAAIVARITKVDLETIRNGIRPIYGEEIRPAEIQPQLDAALKFGFLSRAVNASELIGR
jgi:NitT/TauT family transport system substrate-binding protein